MGRSVIHNNGFYKKFKDKMAFCVEQLKIAEPMHGLLIGYHISTSTVIPVLGYLKIWNRSLNIWNRHLKPILDFWNIWNCSLFETVHYLKPFISSDFLLCSSLWSSVEFDFCKISRSCPKSKIGGRDLWKRVVNDENESHFVFKIHFVEEQWSYSAVRDLRIRGHS